MRSRLSCGKKFFQVEVNMTQYKFLSWADTHWDEFAAKCVTLADTDRVERDIFQRAVEGQFDFTLFAGDRYLKREPHDETKVRADRVLYDFVHKGTIPHFHLIGNHDWTDNSRKWHTSESLRWFDNIYIMDEAKTYRHKDILIHALPADFELDMSKYEIDKDCFNLFVFHDTARGAYMNEERSMIFESGLDFSSFDIPDFQLVLAGDIHVRQQFPLKTTFGGYLGSALQRTRADSNADRGWTEFTVVKNWDKWEIGTEFVPTKNLFTRLAFDVNVDTKLEDIILKKDQVEEQFVEIKFSGNKVDVDRISDDDKWKRIEKNYNARKVEILRAYETEQSNVVVDLTSSTTVLNDLELYLDSAFASTGNISAESIMETVRKISGNEGEER
ncbi:metallophosphoesterase [bacterium]|nr:metallophosphoesterase [bacterium]